MKTLKKIAICAAALVAATITTQLAQAGNKGGVSASSPGHKMEAAKIEPPKGASTFAPGHVKPADSSAKEFAPGDSNKKNKKQ